MSDSPEAMDDDGFGAAEPPTPERAIVGAYYRGTVVRLSLGLESGVVRSASGREIPFRFEHVSVVGEGGGAAALRRGQAVGFDVGWTSRGLCVTKIRPLSDDEAHGTKPVRGSER